MNELNKKLAEQIGFRFFPDDIGGLGGHGADQYVREKRGWKYPNDYRYHDNLPDFPNDLNACFKWLEPETQTGFSVLFREVHWNDGTILTQCELTLDVQRRIVGLPVEGRMKDKAALAFCKAIEQLIDAKCEQ